MGAGSMQKVLAAVWLLGICLSVVFGNETKSIPPQDQDGSGDDEDFFSGSGFDPLLPVDPLLTVENKEIDLYLTTSPLVPIVVQEPTAQQPDADDRRHTTVEHTTRDIETAKPLEGPIEAPIVPISQDVTTHRPTTHRTSTARFTTSKMETTVHDAARKHHHHHHHHHHNTTTINPSLPIDSSVHEPHHEGTTPSPSHAGESHVHHGHHEHPTSKPSETADSHVHHGHHEQPATSPSSADGSNVHFGHQDEIITSPSQHVEPDHDGHEDPSTTPADLNKHHHPPHHHHTTTINPSLPIDSRVHEPHHEGTTPSPSHAGEAHVHHGQHEHPTTKPSETADSHVHHDHHEHPTTKPSETADSHVHHGHHEQSATSPSHHIHIDHDRHEDLSTTPADLNKHHHHHHHSHTDATTTSSTGHTTVSDMQHQFPNLVPKGRIVPDITTTSAIPMLNGDEHIPGEDADSVDMSTRSPMDELPFNVSAVPVSDENEVDSPEDEGSGEGKDSRSFFFEATREVPIVEVPIMRNTNVDNLEEVPTASRGIMDRKEVLGGVIAGGVAGLIFAVSLVAYMLYRMKMKDEGSYSLEEPKQSNGGYQKPREQREFYA